MTDVINLINRQEVDLSPSVPFHFEGTVYKPSHFPASVDYYENNCLWLPIRLNETIYGIQLYPHPQEPTIIKMAIFSENVLADEEIRTIISEVHYRFDMDADLQGFIQLADKDAILSATEKKWRGMKVSCAFSLYELLCITIVLQNAQVSRSVNMLKNMLTTYGRKVRFDNREFFSFWLPSEMANITEDELRSLKVGYRAKSFKKVSSFFLQNPNFEYQVRNLSKLNAAKELRQIYGVGPATCGYLLFEKFHHYDALDYISPWETRIFGMLIFGDQEVPSDVILGYAKDKWGRWRMLAAHYLFEDIFWRRKTESIRWLDDLIRL